MQDLNALGKYIIGQDQLNYSKVARHLGITKQSVWQLCRQKNLFSHLSVDKIISIAHMQNIDPAYLLDKLIKLSKEQG